MLRRPYPAIATPVDMVSVADRSPGQRAPRALYCTHVVAPSVAQLRQFVGGCPWGGAFKFRGFRPMLPRKSVDPATGAGRWEDGMAKDGRLEKKKSLYFDILLERLISATTAAGQLIQAISLSTEARGRTGGIGDNSPRYSGTNSNVKPSTTTTNMYSTTN